jgi:hypothetical protein
VPYLSCGVSGELEVVRPSGAVETLVMVHSAGQFTGNRSSKTRAYIAGIKKIYTIAKQLD